MTKQRTNITETYIVVPAYRAGTFIKECLDAACKQGNVLLGVDGCKDTLKKVKDIRHKYKNLRVFWFPENKGTYLTFNALIDYVPDNAVFITFGADDVMNKGMAKQMVKNMPCHSHHPGVLCITKELWNEMGGFRPWRVGADKDFIKRIRLKYNVQKLGKLFYRREHPDQLTKKETVGLKSKLRSEMRGLIRENLKSNNPKMYFEPEKNIGKEI